MRFDIWRLIIFVNLNENLDDWFRNSEKNEKKKELTVFRISLDNLQKWHLYLFSKKATDLNSFIEELYNRIGLQEVMNQIENIYGFQVK